MFALSRATICCSMLQPAHPCGMPPTHPPVFAPRRDPYAETSPSHTPRDRYTSRAPAETPDIPRNPTCRHSESAPAEPPCPTIQHAISISSHPPFPVALTPQNALQTSCVLRVF